MTNTACPDFSSHQANAAELLFGLLPGATTTTEQDEAIQAAALAEYRACEGH